MLTKNNVESKKNAVTKEDLEKLVAAKDPEVLNFDFLNEVVDILKDDYQTETKDNPMSFNQWLDSKPDSYFKRFSYSDGGKVIDFLSYAKMKQPEIKKLNLAQGDFDRAVIDVKSDIYKSLIKELLRRSGINVGGSND